MAKHPHVPGESVYGLADFFNTFCPEFVGMTYRPLVVKIRDWDGAEFAPRIHDLNAEQAAKRWAAYVGTEEVARVADKLRGKDNASFRFGVKKEGYGYRGERGDFCLIGGAIRQGHLTVFYRRLELINGWSWDAWMLERLHAELKAAGALAMGSTWKTVQIMAVQADIFAREGATGQYERLKELYAR